MVFPRSWRRVRASRASESRDGQEAKDIYPGDIDRKIYPGKLGGPISKVFPMANSPHPNFTAFVGQRLLAAGPLAEVALAVMNVARRPAAPPIIIFSDATGR